MLTSDFSANNKYKNVANGKIQEVEKQQITNTKMYVADGKNTKSRKTTNNK